MIPPRPPDLAVLLAAGRGERLGPVGERTPKALLEVGGRTLIEWNLETLRDAGARRFLVNLHHLGDRIVERLGDGRRMGVEISYFPEERLLGTAGALVPMRDALAGGPFWVAYADTIRRIDPLRLWALHAERGAVATIGLHRPDDPRRSGIVETAADGRVLAFTEKPADPPPDARANAGIYVLSPEVAGGVREGDDFGRDVFPRLVARGAPLYAFDVAGEVIDVGTPESLERARRKTR